MYLKLVEKRNRNDVSPVYRFGLRKWGGGFEKDARKSTLVILTREEGGACKCPGTVPASG